MTECEKYNKEIHDRFVNEKVNKMKKIIKWFNDKEVDELFKKICDKVLV